MRRRQDEEGSEAALLCEPVLYMTPKEDRILGNGFCPEEEALFPRAGMLRHSGQSPAP